MANNTKSISGNVVPIGKLPIHRGHTIEKQPAEADLIYHARVAAERARWVEIHPLVEQNPMPTGCSVVDKLNMIKHETAKEVATLMFNRIELEKRGQDTTPVSVRIVNALKNISSIELEVKKLGHTVIDPNSTEMQNILGVWIDALKATLSDLVKARTLDEPTMDLIYNKFAGKMEGWEKRIKGG